MVWVELELPTQSKGIKIFFNTVRLDSAKGPLCFDYTYIMILQNICYCLYFAYFCLFVFVWGPQKDMLTPRISKLGIWDPWRWDIEFWWRKSEELDKHPEVLFSPNVRKNSWIQNKSAPKAFLLAELCGVGLPGTHRNLHQNILLGGKLEKSDSPILCLGF